MAASISTCGLLGPSCFVQICSGLEAKDDIAFLYDDLAVTALDFSGDDAMFDVKRLGGLR